MSFSSFTFFHKNEIIFGNSLITKNTAVVNDYNLIKGHTRLKVFICRIDIEYGLVSPWQMATLWDFSPSCCDYICIVMWWIVLILHNTGNVHDYNSGGVLNSLCISLEQICWFSIDYWDYLRLYLRLFLGSNQCVSNIVEIMVLPPSKHACYIVLSILWWETGRENGSRTTHVPTPGRFFLFWMKTQPKGLGRLCKPITGGGGGILIHSLTRVTPPPSTALSVVEFNQLIWFPIQALS